MNQKNKNSNGMKHDKNHWLKVIFVSLLIIGMVGAYIPLFFIHPQ